MSSILIMVFASIILFGLAILGMSIGLIVRNRPLSGGCGSKTDNNGNFIPCDSCSADGTACRNDLHKALIDDDFRKTFGQYARKT